MRKFIIELNNPERECESLYLLALLQKFHGAKVTESTSLDEEIREAKALLSPNESAAFDQILPIFKHNLKHALDFLIRIRGEKPPQITRDVCVLVRDGIIHPDSCKTALWRALYNNGLYPRGESNWHDQIVVPKTLKNLNSDWKT